jgi:hypothetical protein
LAFRLEIAPKSRTHARKTILKLARLCRPDEHEVILVVANHLRLLPALVRHQVISCSKLNGVNVVDRNELLQLNGAVRLGLGAAIQAPRR